VLPVVSRLSPSEGRRRLFDGKTLAGWHVLGPASWRAEKGEIVGSASGGAGWLVLDRGYEEVGVQFSFRCAKCEAGVLVRGAKAGNNTEGTYFSLAGPDAGTLFRVTLDAGGRETGRKSLGALIDRNKEPVTRMLKPGDWNEVWSLCQGRGPRGYVQS